MQRVLVTTVAYPPGTSSPGWTRRTTRSERLLYQPTYIGCHTIPLSTKAGPLRCLPCAPSHVSPTLGSRVVA